MVIHWLEEIDLGLRRRSGHVNPIRISAENMVKLIDLKNNLRGTKYSIYEESLLAGTQE